MLLLFGWTEPSAAAAVAPARDTPSIPAPPPPPPHPQITAGLELLSGSLACRRGLYWAGGVFL